MARRHQVTWEYKKESRVDAGRDDDYCICGSEWRCRCKVTLR